MKAQNLFLLYVCKCVRMFEQQQLQQVCIYMYICYGRQLSTSMLYDLTVGSTYIAQVVLFLLHRLSCVDNRFAAYCVCVCVCMCVFVHACVHVQG